MCDTLNFKLVCVPVALFICLLLFFYYLFIFIYFLFFDYCSVNTLTTTTQLTCSSIRIPQKRLPFYAHTLIHTISCGYCCSATKQNKNIIYLQVKTGTPCREVVLLVSTG